jgi:general secretion pathway protein K
MQNQRRRQQRGVALIMVLSTLTILAVMLTEFQQETSAELGSAMSERDAVQAEYSAKSAIALTRLIIAAEPTIRQSPTLGMILALMGFQKVQIPIWEHADLLLSVFNDEKSSKEFGKTIGGSFAQTKGLGLPGTSFEVVIVDEDSKLNFNYAARGTVASNMVVTNQFLSLVRGTQYDQIFEGRDSEGNFKDRRIVCSALVDWADPNIDAEPCTPELATAAQTAAEDTFYEGLKRPYSRKNAAFDSLEELHLVRGIDDEFWNTFIDPDPDNPKKRIVTVWGSDKVNVNTANGITLAALVCQYAATSPACTDPVMRAKIVSVIEMVRGFTPGMPMFTGPNGFIKALSYDPTATTTQPGATQPGATQPGAMPNMAGMLFSMMGIPPLQINGALLKERIKVKSDIFSVYAKGVVKSGRRETTTRIHAVIDFRGAPPPGQVRATADELARAGLSEAAAMAAASASATPSASASAVPTNLLGNVDTTEITPESVLAALQASAGGHIIYYRIN